MTFSTFYVLIVLQPGYFFSFFFSFLFLCLPLNTGAPQALRLPLPTCPRWESSCAPWALVLTTVRYLFSPRPLVEAQTWTATTYWISPLGRFTNSIYLKLNSWHSSRDSCLPYWFLPIKGISIRYPSWPTRILHLNVLSFGPHFNHTTMSKINPLLSSPISTILGQWTTFFHFIFRTASWLTFLVVTLTLPYYIPSPFFSTHYETNQIISLLQPKTFSVGYYCS